MELKWSKKENDWIFKYPNRAAESMTNIFFDMIKIEKHIDYIDKKTLKEMLDERGFDHTSLKLTIYAKL